MRLQASVDGEKHEIEITRDGDSVFASVDERSYELETSEPEAGVLLFKHNGRVFEVFVNGRTVQIGGHSLGVEISDPKKLRGSSTAVGHEHGHAEIKTAMPGKVMRILKLVGDEVTTGEGVIVVEAMKMQNEMKAPMDGSIKEIHVAEGETVSAGDVLVVIE